MRILGDPLMSLDRTLQRFVINDRYWNVLAMRYGFESRLTYKEIGDRIGGVTRARSQQIVAECIYAVHRGFDQFLTPLLQIESTARTHKDSLSFCKVDRFIPAFQDCLESTGWLRPSDLNSFRFMILIRTLVANRFANFDLHFPGITFAICSINPAIQNHCEIHARQAEAERELREQSRKWTYLELAKAILDAAGEPLHFRVVADQASKLNHRSRVAPSQVHKIMFLHKELFINVGPGTYGLRTWGIEPVTSFTHIVADTLSDEGKPLSRSEIYELVCKKRQIAPTTLERYLSEHPRFYRTPDGTYGLREWLSGAHPTASLTEDAFIETKTSLARIKRYKDRNELAKLIRRQRQSGY
jgi:hypothetical protein